MQFDGFSKLSKQGKIAVSEDGPLWPGVKNIFHEFTHSNAEVQKLIDEFSENSISNFHLPYSVAPNFKINGEFFTVPMAIEESSVVAAVSKAAKFWSIRGGIEARVLGTKKIGHIHFSYKGEKEVLFHFFERYKTQLMNCNDRITQKMRRRGGGILDLKLEDHCTEEEFYYTVEMSFETCDAMGANFINTVLENTACEFEKIWFENNYPNKPQIIMSILSNYTPECLVEAKIQCPLTDLVKGHSKISAHEFAEKMIKAIRIAHVNPYRATTHNKGIFNGIDALILATGNDFRAVEACAHAYAAQDGQYRSLTHAKIIDDIFHFSIKIPLALGSIGGLTGLHPLAKISLALLKNPNAKELMMIAASVGLMQNYSAISALVTTGIQKGHMKMHLLNILKQLHAGDEEQKVIIDYFSDKVIVFSEVHDYLLKIRGEKLH